MISPRRLSSPPASSSAISKTASEMIDFQVSAFKSDAKVRPTLPERPPDLRLCVHRPIPTVEPTHDTAAGRGREM